MLCDKCHKYQINKPSKNCDFCTRLGFSEEVLCCLARNGSEHGKLTECGAYRPKLSLASPEQKDSIPKGNREANKSGLTEKEKWFRAYSKQQLQLNPEEIHFKLQFHVCLVSKKRNLVFSNSNKYFEKTLNIFHQIANNFENTQIEVLWLCSDHIHLYINTTPDYSLDEIVDKVIRNSEKEIQSSYPEVMNEFSGIWESGYFAETIE